MDDHVETMRSFILMAVVHNNLIEKAHVKRKYFGLSEVKKSHYIQKRELVTDEKFP